MHKHRFQLNNHKKFMRSFPFVALLLLCILAACNVEDKPSSNATPDSSATNPVAEELLPSVDTMAAIPDSTTMEKPCCTCSVSAYLNDPDKSGTNIRETPKGKAKGKLTYDPNCDCKIVSFKGSKDGWMELNEGGWVFAELFAVDTRNYGQEQKLFLYESANVDSKVVAEYLGERQMTILGCEGTWLYVKGKDGKKGWLPDEMVCANPLTTCP